MISISSRPTGPLYRHWGIAAALVLHANVLLLPLVWARLHTTAAPNRVEVLLVQSEARTPAPALSHASSSARSKPRKQATPVPVPVPLTTASASQSVTDTTPISKPAETSAKESAAGAPPAELPRFDPAYLNNQAPIYPTLSRRLGEQGRVLLRVYVRADGTALETQVDRSSGSPRLDAAARKAVARWKFVPATRGDTAVGAWVVVPIFFSLEG